MYLNKQVRKALLAMGVTGALGVASTGAMATVYPDFNVNASNYGGPSFTADKITGNYTEIATFGAGTFDVSVLWQGGQFVKNDGTQALSAAQTGLGTDYGLYGLFQGSGTFTTSGGTSHFSLGSGSLSLYGDGNNDTTFTAPGTGAGAWTTGNAGDDALLATGSILSGAGNLNPNNCVGNLCGSFGQTTTFSLTNPAGTDFFAFPHPFYNLSLQSGQFNLFTPSGTVTLNGSMDAIFAVPEPATIALMGMGLIGMGLGMRKSKA